MILLTGGSGRLGTELRKLRDFYAPSSSEFDITKDKVPECDLIVHCAAYTYVERAEIEKDVCFKINVEGTRNLAKSGIPILYISTEHVFSGETGNYNENDVPNPCNFYGLTKLLGEYSLNEKSKILRLTLKPKPFPYPGAFIDQFISGDYVDVIAKEVIIAIENFAKLPNLIHIGTGRKSVYDLAKQTRDVQPISRLSVKGAPYDTSLCIDKWNRFKKEVL